MEGIKGVWRQDAVGGGKERKGGRRIAREREMGRQGEGEEREGLVGEADGGRIWRRGGNGSGRRDPRLSMLSDGSVDCGRLPQGREGAPPRPGRQGRKKIKRLMTTRRRVTADRHKLDRGEDFVLILPRVLRVRVVMVKVVVVVDGVSAVVIVMTTVILCSYL
ncbi:hypothetical protein E2C01_003728 [Portunus trituberculatus]|uniref:Uncharacterized protein n=1 Tax=Portunus trituberculatus TaxID=210409 RepID=A0A5B7CPF2_PORTR|nr:hypothetical protein [Portunus trituberculatus]